MSFDDDNSLPPDQIGAALAGDLGGEMQAAQMKIWLPQYIESVMTRARMTAGAGVALSDGLEETMIYEP